MEKEEKIGKAAKRIEEDYVRVDLFETDIHKANDEEAELQKFKALDEQLWAIAVKVGTSEALIEYIKSNNPVKQHRNEAAQMVQKMQSVKEVKAILIFKDNGTDKTIEISKTPFVIGRSGKNTDYQCDIGYISRVHIEITCIQGVYRVRDLDTKNGTFLNGKRLKKDIAATLKNSDVITLAKLECTFMLI